MDPERWQRLTELFHQAVELDPAHREAFLDEHCGGETELRDEVASLLAYHGQANQILDGPAALEVDGDREEEAASLVGQSLDQYRVTRQLGSGGMGVVYLADDMRLGRHVALKVLTRRFTKNPERRERLRREARAAAALSHPAIATVYALEEVGDTLFIVSEYVEGPTLRDEVSRSPLLLPALLDTGVDIARALTAAHERGIVHRDLKPENVIRTADGGIKVLDFGLADVAEAADVGAGAGRRLTEPGMMLGTPGYMPPEQIRGQKVDFRADLFSFGVMFFELASGVHPFASSTSVSTIARVLEAPPDLGKLQPTCPDRLRRVIARCLQKEPGLRYGSAAELAHELEALRFDADGAAPASVASTGVGGGSGSTMTPPPRGTPLWWWQFHQVGISLGYGAMLVPLWNLRVWVPAPWGSALFFTTVVAIGIATTLRLHLWFTSRFYPEELPVQQIQASRWIRLGDWLLVVMLLLAGGLVASDHAGFSTLFVAVAVASVVSFSVIEPATTRAAFK